MYSEKTPVPAVMFGVASVAALWWLAMNVVTRWEAPLSSLLFAVSYHHIWFSQNARGYTGLLFFSLLATLFFLKGVEWRSLGWWLAYDLVFAAAMYIHPSAVFLFVAHALVYAVYRGRIRKDTRASNKQNTSYGVRVLWEPFFAFLLGAALTAILYSVLVPQMIEAFTATSAMKAKSTVNEWKNPIWTLLEVANNFRHPGWASCIAIPVAGGLGIVGFVHLLK